MRSISRFIARLRHAVTRTRADQRLQEEIESHIAAQTAENILGGMSPQQARRHAMLSFGALQAVRESHHSEHSLPIIDNLLLDVRYALRVLRKSPAFTLVAATTLMLGIGANVVIFGVFNAILLTPLAVSHPENLYQLRHQQWMTGRLLTSSYPAFEDFRRRNTTFIDMAGIYAYSHASLIWQNAQLSLSGTEVTGNYFDLLGVQPQAGRFFHEADEQGPNSSARIVLSDTSWKNAFHADPSVVGATVEFNKHLFTVVGIAPPSFHGLEYFAHPDYWIPMVNEEQIEVSDYLHRRASIAVTVIGRIKPGVTPQQATDNLNVIAAELAVEYPVTDDGQPLRLIHPGLIGDEGDVIRGFLVSVFILALLVLAAACANLAGLFAARAADRSRELALRVALGSSRRRIVQQLLTEAVIVSLIGGAAGLIGARTLLGALNRWHSPYGHLEVSVDARVYLAGLAFTLISAFLFGILPAWQAGHGSPLQNLKINAGDVVHFRRFALRDLLLGAQIAICTLLVTSSLVAVRGLMHALETPLGFSPQGAVLINIDMAQFGQPQESLDQKQRSILDAARGVPGVTAAGAISRTPFTGGMRGVPVFMPGTTDFKLNNAVLAPYVFEMSPGYLDTAGTRILSGRDFTANDIATTPRVAIVNQLFAEKLFAGTPATGRQFIVNGNLTQIVGVAQDGKYHDLQESPQPVVYLPFSQVDGAETVFVVRSPRAPSQTSAALQRALAGIAPNLPISAQSWLDDLRGELFPAKAATVALGSMGLLAAMLAATGIFAMAAYSVSRRMKELGIRVALGARKPQIMAAAIGRPLVLLGFGSALGLLFEILATRLLTHIVYQANPRDPLVVAGAVLTMALLGLAAAALPARRALAIDPARLMRED